MEEIEKKVNELIKIGIRYVNQQDFEEALKYFEKALKVNKKLAPENNIYKVETLSNIGLAYFGLNDFDQSLKYLEEALVISKQIFSANDPFIAKQLYYIGNTYNSQAKYTEALKYFLDSFEVYKKVPPLELIKNISDFEDVIFNIAQRYKEQREFKEALKYYEEFLKVSRQKYPPNYENVIKALIGIGVSYAVEKNFTKALQNLEEALNLSKEMLTDDDILRAEVLYSFGELFILQKKFHEALNYFKESFALNRNEITSRNSSIVENTFLYMTLLYFKLGDIKEATRYTQYHRDFFLKRFRNISILKENEEKDEVGLKKLEESLNRVYKPKIVATTKLNAFDATGSVYDSHRYDDFKYFEESRNHKLPSISNHQDVETVRYLDQTEKKSTSGSVEFKGLGLLILASCLLVKALKK